MAVASRRVLLDRQAKPEGQLMRSRALYRASMSFFRQSWYLRLVAGLALWASLLVSAHPVAHAVDHSHSAESCGPAYCQVDGSASPILASLEHAHDDSHEHCLLCTLGAGRWGFVSAKPTAPVAIPSFARLPDGIPPVGFVPVCEHEHSLTRRGPPSPPSL